MPERKKPVGPSRYADKFSIIFGSLLVFAAFTAFIVIAAAGLSGWHSDNRWVIAAAMVVVTAVLAVAQLCCRLAEHKASSRVLANAEIRLTRLLELATDAIVTIDEERRITLYNAAAEKLFLWPRAAVLKQAIDRLIPKGIDCIDGASRQMDDLTITTGVRANGEEFPLEASISQFDDGEQRHFTLILRDITKRTRAEQERTLNEARLQGILDSAMDAVITVDERQHIVLFNAAAEVVFQCARDEAIGAPLTWFIPDRFRATHAEQLRRFGETNIASRRMGGAQRVVKALRRNGEEFPIEASISQMSESGARFYTVILRDVTERVLADEELRHSKQELREFAAAANTVREQEKSRIARELHDELAQALTALKMDVTWVIERMPAGHSALDNKLEQMLTMLNDTVKATRRISSDLRPLMLDDLGLIPATEWLVENFIERTGLVCDLTIPAPDMELPEPYATAVFRILQESLTNVARHAHASLVEVIVAQTGGEVRLSVRDNGRGFQVSDPHKPNSYGLLGLRERVYLVGGEVRIDSKKGRGTLIEVRIPTTATGVHA